MPLGAPATTVATVVGLPTMTVEDPEPEAPLISPGEMSAGADFARAAKLSMVRGWFAAGLLNGTLVSFMLSCLAGTVSVGGKRNLCINDPDHTGLVVLALRAIEPKRLRVIDHDGVCRHLSAATGMKPEKKPVTLDWILLQGWSKVDCTTEWFCEHVSTLIRMEREKESYLREELKLRHRSILRFNVIGLEVQASILVGDFDHLYTGHARVCG